MYLQLTNKEKQRYISHHTTEVTFNTYTRKILKAYLHTITQMVVYLY